MDPVPPASGAPAPEPPLAEEPCAGCGRTLKPGASFCTGCGRRRGSLGRAPETFEDRHRKIQRAWGEIRFVVVFYLLLLGTSALMLVLVRVTERTFAPMVLGIALDSLIIGAAAIKFRRFLAPAVQTPGFGPSGFLLVLAAAPFVLLAVHAYVGGLSAFFRIRPESLLALFEGQPLPVVLALGAAWPAFFEELAFRGVVFFLLRRHATLREAFIISSFAFAILHLSIPSLVTHLPLGLYLCWLRHRSGSLWPAVAAHFLHNTGVILMESLDFRLPFLS